MRHCITLAFVVICCSLSNAQIRTTITDKLVVKQQSNMVNTITEGKEDTPALTVGGVTKDDILLAVSGSYVLDGTHSQVFADATAGNVAIALPSAALNLGWTYCICRTDLTGNEVSIALTSFDVLIWGETQICVKSNGTRWVVY